MPARACAFSSSGSGTSASTPIRVQARSSSTGPYLCVIRGRRSSNVRKMNRLSLAAVLCASTVSASPSVHFGKLDVVHFKSRALNAVRTVRVWLPPRFSRHTRYAVLYLNDGQNLFGDGNHESGGGGWHVDETAARLIAAHEIDPLIVVGIDSGDDRSRAADYVPVVDPFSDDPQPSRADEYL